MTFATGTELRDGAFAHVNVRYMNKYEHLQLSRREQFAVNVYNFKVLSIRCL